MKKDITPLLKWAGSKYRQTEIINRLRQHWEPYRDKGYTYVEPFCGGLGSIHRIMPDTAILSDLNPYLIRFYQVIQKGNTIWYEWVRESSYAQLRDLFNEQLSPNFVLSDPHFLSVFYQLNHRSYNGLWRVNLRGKYNVPEGKNSKQRSHIARFPELKPYRDLYHGWSFTCQEWLSTIVAAPPESFIYCDPPYDDGFVSYAGGFNWDDQQELATIAASTHHPIVMSNRATERVIALYERLGFTIDVIPGNRSIAANGDRSKVNEVLAHKNLHSAS